MMKVAFASTGVTLSDGATNIMPVAPHKNAATDDQKRANKAAVHAAWRLHADDVRRSLVTGFYQGWDLHPAQLPTRYGAVYAFFLEGLAAASERLSNFVGKAAQARGLPMDHYAFPDIGVPSYSPVGPQVDRCMVYAIVRTESGFDQRDMSSAKAVGLMQVTPGAGRDTAKRFGVTYDWKRLVSDPVYNTQMGAAEISALLKDYRGSFILTFAGYNAGRGRVEQWVALHGDPRDPKVDAVDWVERIPFAETRNYVQRVIENLEVYRGRFGESTAAFEPNLHRAAAIDWPATPAPIEQRPVTVEMDLSGRN